VVGVPIDAVVVVADDGGGAHACQRLGQPDRRVVEHGTAERAGRRVRRVTGHARVVVAEELDAPDPEDAGGRLALPAADAGQAGVVDGPVVGRVQGAELTTGGDDEHDRHPGRRQTGHRAAREDRLVVGMGVHEHDRHPSIVAHSPSGPHRTDV